MAIGLITLLLPLLVLGGIGVVVFILFSVMKNNSSNREVDYRRPDSEFGRNESNVTSRATIEIDPDEQRKILKMVADQKITAEDAEKLLDSIKEVSSKQKCPYCAETIAGDSSSCPECKTSLIGGANKRTSGKASNNKSGFFALGGASKFLIIYQFVIGLIMLSSLIKGFHVSTGLNSILAAVAIVSAILMFKGNKIGWILGICWSGAQIIQIYHGFYCINKQFFHVGVNSLTNGSGLGFNLVGVILIIIYYASRHDWINTNSGAINEDCYKLNSGV